MDDCYDEKIAVSIIVPCYGVEKYLNRCIETLVSQSLKSIEIILVDDGSPDNVPRMCDEWEKIDSRIRVVHKKNAGLGFARNSGLEIARGKYVAFVDSDDFVERDMYEKLLKKTESYNYDVVLCGYNNFKDGVVSFGESKSIDCRTEEDVLDVLAEMTASKLTVRSYRELNMVVWRGIYKRSILADNDIWFHSERDYLSEDIVFDYDFLPKCKSLAYIPDTCYYYCYNGQSLSHTYRKEVFRKVSTLIRYLASVARTLEKEDLLLERIDRLYCDYSSSTIRSIISSNMPCIDKKSCFTDVFADISLHNSVNRLLKNKLPIFNCLKLKILRSQSFALNYFFWKLMNIVKP